MEFKKKDILPPFKLRDYQITALNKIDKGLKKKRNNLFVAIMGAGKTIVTARLINKYYKNSSKNFLILTHKKELVSQFKETFRTKTEVRNKDVGICCSGLDSIKDINKRIVIGTVQSFINIKKKYKKKCDLLIFDEVHRSLFDGRSQFSMVYNYLLNNNKKMRFLGLTATPYRLGHGYIYGKKCVNKDLNIFTNVTANITYNELVSKNYLSKLKGIIAVSKGLDKGLKSIGLGASGDFLTDGLSILMGKEQHLKNIKTAYYKYATNKKCICILCVDIIHAEKAYKLLNEAGISVTIVHSGISSIERIINMKAWEDGKIQIMISVNLLIEGYDLPRMDCIINTRPTKSPVLFFQALGRPLRLFNGKENALFIDLTSNTKTFGIDLDNIKIKIPKNKKKKKDIDEKTEKICPECGGVFHKTLKTCIDCGFTFRADEIKQYELDFPVVEEVEFTGNDNNSENEDVEIFDVNYMFFNVNISKNNKKQGTIVFGYGEKNITTYFCLSDFYSGYAVQKAEENWGELKINIPFPQNITEWEIISMDYQDTIDEPEKYKEMIITPKQIKIDSSLDFPFIKEYIFKEEDILINNKKKEVIDDDIPF